MRHPLDNPQAARAMADMASKQGMRLLPWHRENMARHGVDASQVSFFGVPDQPKPEEAK